MATSVVRNILYRDYICFNISVCNNSVYHDLKSNKETWIGYRLNLLLHNVNKKRDKRIG